jgi:hypothetical protein
MGSSEKKPNFFDQPNPLGELPAISLVDIKSLNCDYLSIIRRRIVHIKIAFNIRISSLFGVLRSSAPLFINFTALWDIISSQTIADRVHINT